MGKDSEIKKLVGEEEFDEVVNRHLEGEVVVPEIVSLLEDEDEDVRGNAVLTLGEIGEKDPEAVREAIPGLIGLLGDEYEYVRGDTAFALGAIGEEEPYVVKEAIPELIDLLDDEDWYILVGVRSPDLTLFNGVVRSRT